MKIDLEALRRRYAITVSSVHSGRFQAAKAEFCQLLESVGYSRHNATLYDALVSYAARLKCDATRKGLVLMGGLGLGKSTGAELLAAWCNVHFVTASDLATAYSTGGDPALEAMAMPLQLGDATRPLDLIIDEVGREPLNSNYFGTKKNVLEQVLRLRYIVWQRYKARTIITTNAALRSVPGNPAMPSIETLYGDDIADRLQEMCNIPQINGNDLRQIRPSA